MTTLMDVADELHFTPEAVAAFVTAGALPSFKRQDVDVLKRAIAKWWGTYEPGMPESYHSPHRDPHGFATIVGLVQSIRTKESDMPKDIGLLLIAAKHSCPHGEWVNWLINSGLSFSMDAAEKYMAAARCPDRRLGGVNPAANPVT